ncbi:response regulator [Chryseobacterium sp. C-71]|uniref:response regulator n=1 Tax=Chryseobacterium sp. C-71 TaxID=2893882 RepID=UPI001E33CF5F|nr:response regulator [Chryseobacterium sp. C-71]UFH31896.1 response regulator [Chryseobacterium sp. C-71]
MNHFDSNNQSSDQRDIDKLKTFEKKYADAFDFLVFAAAKMTNMELCTMSISSEEQVYIIASSDASPNQIYPQNPHFLLDDQTSIYEFKNSEFKFHRSYLIPCLEDNLIVHLNLFDRKEKNLDKAEKEIVNKILNQASKWYLANAVDITERIKMENEILAAKELAEKAYVLKSEFVANMSHEIRTPLNGIIGFTELALETNLDETQRQYLEIINQSGVSLYSIINDILDFSKLEKQKLQLNLDKVEIEELVSEAFNIVSYGNNKKHLEMLIDIDDTIPRYIWTDEMRLKRVLVNLLSNALKFTEEGEIVLYVKVLNDLGEGKKLIRFGVRDTGIGIDKDKQAEIFDAFSQEDGGITKRYGGTGLGLRISNQILALAGSTIKLESEQGKGSDFFFDIQFDTQEEEYDLSLTDIKKVLIVDDNENNRKILKRMLERKNIEVEECDSGLKALLLIMDKPQFDVIIMDYHMPIMDGIETIRKMRNVFPETDHPAPYIVLYSSSDDSNLQDACDELEIENRLVKPIRMKQMYQVLSTLKNSESKKLDKIKNVATEGSKHDIKILIAEDNAINLLLTKTYLKEILPQALIIDAKDGAEAVEKYQKESPDLILMDIQMPQLNGIEATRKIRSMESNIEIPIIALTAGSLPGEKEKCFQAGMSDFLTKPLLKKTLSDMIKKWSGIGMKGK